MDFYEIRLFDRPIMEGIYSGGTYETHKAALANQTNFGEEIDRAAYNYTNQCYPNIDNANILNIIPMFTIRVSRDDSG